MGRFATFRDKIGGLFRRGAEVMKAADNFISVDEIARSLPRTRYPYGRDVREGLDSGVVMAPINWILRNFTEAELVMQRKRKGMWEPLDTHPLIELVDRPNPFYDGDLLWKATALSYFLDGNAYWLKVRNTLGMVIQLWYIPHFLIEPVAPKDGLGYLSHYNYRPRGFGQPIELAPRDVVHYRFGLDPRNTRKGLSALKPLLREVFTDDEAANFSATILRNMGVPGGVMSPSDATTPPSPEDVKEMKEYMRSGFTGDKRGEWLVLGTPTKLEQFGFDPQALMLGSMRDIAEERVCAALGIPAAVVGFGAGLQSTKVGATMKELRRLAWTSCLQPSQRTLARQLTQSMVPEVMSQTRRFRIRFDVSSVPAFQEEEHELTKKIALQVTTGLLRVDRAQEQLGLEVDDTQEIYLRPTNVVAVKPGEEPPPPAPPPPPGAPEPDNEGEGDDDQEGKQLLNRARALVEAHRNGGG